MNHPTISKSERKTHYTLDLNKWRSGKNGKHATGTGNTQLLNREGFSCCLGQFALQAGVSEKQCLDISTPLDLALQIQQPYDENFIYFRADRAFYSGSPLTLELMIINDNPNSTVKQKIASITATLAEAGIALTVIDSQSQGESQ